MRQLKTWKFVFLILCLSTLAACGTSAQNATLEGSAATPTAAAAPTQAQPPADSGGATPAEAAPGMLSFVIVPGESEARFIIDEVLAGSPNTVVGTTQEIEGQLSVDPQDPAGASISTITIGAGSLATDNNFRNRAISSFILQTGDYPTITFTPSAVAGLPAAAAVGDTLNFQVTGDLTIRDITQAITFDVTVNVESETRLSGTAKSTVNRADFDLKIPSVAQVANVSEQVQLELDFVAEVGS
jgi:polyisoprenoid-binding protein YceI